MYETMRRNISSRFLILLSTLLCHLCLTELAFSAELADIELSGYALGSWPHDQDIANQGRIITASVQQGFGAGVKVGFFPSGLHGIMGLALDSNIHSGAFSFPSVATHDTGHSDLLVTNTTVNLILRYPGKQVRPYAGIGMGWSSGILLNPNIAGRNDTDFDSAYAFVHQFLGGTQVFLNTKVFVFGEYRYLSSDYHWNGLAVDFRTHYGLLGAGLRF